MATQSKTLWRVAGAVLLLLGLVNVGDGFLGKGRLLAGRLFYADHEVSEWVAKAGPTAQVFARACDDPRVSKRFDSRSVKTFERWCTRVVAFQSDPTGETGVALMRGNNRHFDMVTDKLFVAGGDLAQLGLDLMTARATFRPAMEKVGSVRAGAAFSQTLVGFMLLIAGWFCLRRGRRSP